MTSIGRPVRLVFTRVADFGDDVAAGRLLGHGVGPDGTIVTIVGDAPTTGRRRTRRAVFVRDRMVRRIDLEPVELLTYIGDVMAQPLPDGGVLLVEGWRGPGETNAVVFGSDGHVSQRFAVGDCVGDCLLDESSCLWVSYSEPDLSEWDDPLGLPGLNRFEMTGMRTWSFDPLGGLPPIDDCYALNVWSDQAWACYLPRDSEDAHLIRVDAAGTITAWETGLLASFGILTLPEAVVLVGSYKDWFGANLLGFGDGLLDNPRPITVDPLPGGPFAQRPRFHGRGNTLYVVAGGIWHAARLV